jgi:hypothetical protein
MLARFEAVDTKISSLRNETKSDIESVGKETKSDIESLRKETLAKFEAVDARFDSLEARIPVMEKMASLKLDLPKLRRS